MNYFTIFLFVGDLLVMGFLCFLAAWLLWIAPKEDIDAAMRLPLDDDAPPPPADKNNGGEAA